MFTRSVLVVLLILASRCSTLPVQYIASEGETCGRHLGCLPGLRCDLKRYFRFGTCVSDSTTTTTENVALPCRPDLTDFWPDCRVRIDDRLKHGTDYCTASFDRAGCEKSCCQTTVTTTAGSETLAQCEALSDIAMDCETRIRDRFENGADYCAIGADYRSCERSCCLKIGTPIQFAIAIQGLDYSNLSDDESLEQSLSGEVADTVAAEANVSAQNISITFKQSVSLPTRLRRLRTASVDDEGYLLIEISVFSPEPPSKLVDRISPDLAVQVASTLEHAKGIDAVLQDDISIAGMTAPRVLQSETMKPDTQQILKERSESSSDCATSGSVAALTTAGLAFLVISSP